LTSGYIHSNIFSRDGLDWIGLDGLDGLVGLHGLHGLLTRLLVQLFIHILRGCCSSEPFESTIHHIAFCLPLPCLPCSLIAALLKLVPRDFPIPKLERSMKGSCCG
jgi:hypothetical protein